MAFTERPLGLDASERDARDKELSRLMKEIAGILPYPVTPQARAAFEMALTLHLGGV